MKYLHRATRGFATFIVTMSLGSIAGATWAAEGPLYYKLDFENNSLSGWSVSGNPSEVVTNIVRDGTHAARHLLDYYASDVKYRTELKASGSGQDFRTDDGRVYWYGWSVYFPSDQVPDSLWQIVTQLHQAPDDGEEWSNPVLALYVSDGEWTWTNRWDSREISPKNSFEGSKSWSMGKHPLGQWVDFVINVKWSYESDGFLRIWKNGEKIVDRNGPNCMNNDTIPAFKMGVYKAWRAKEPEGGITRRVLYTDEFRMAGPEGSYAAVAPGGTDSKPMAPANLAVN